MTVQLSSAELRHAVFTREAFDPDDLIVCPFVPSHILKRKKMPYHIPDCKRTNGRGFLACGFSQSHYFRTKDELAHHEAICPMRRQFEGAARAAPSYQSRDANRELGVSPMQKLLLERRQQRAEAHAASALVAERVSKSDSNSEEEDLDAKAARVAGLTEAQIQEREFSLKLHNTVLFSRYRLPQLLYSDDTKHKWLPDLNMLKEEPGEESDNIPEVRPAPVPQPSAPVVITPEEKASQDRKEQDKMRNDRPKTLRDRSLAIGMQYNNRFEDARDSSKNPIDFPVEWSVYAKKDQPLLKAKYHRDNEIFKTGMNPRYRKCMDKPNSDRSRRPNPCEFEELAAWFEDVIWKPVIVKPAAASRPDSELPQARVLSDTSGGNNTAAQSFHSQSATQTETLPTAAISTGDDRKTTKVHFGRFRFHPKDDVGIAY
ncbi:hypothetical protein BV898_16193 [Hypsibius exemplaris]|uniref:CHHC U11-48K-type domain-containing protein n=1 Tax=Hypsibius exemplaris TaxID=2072580 RepID=A0A9X6NFI0_HYPEX|nr:hypothetical protein BV898_16193 [Hypsibius exemplaris]